MTFEVFFLICIAIIAWSIVGFGILVKYEQISERFLRVKTREFCYFNPIWIYKSYKVNYFGCFVLTILFNIACPIATVIYWICKFIKWICTVGRK